MSVGTGQRVKHLGEASNLGGDERASAHETGSPLRPELRRWEQMAQQLAQTETSLLLIRKIFEDGPLGMAVISEDRRFLRVNPAFGRLLGYAPGELAGFHVDDVTHPDDRGLDHSQGRQLWSGDRESYKVRKRYLRKDGRLTSAWLTASILHDEAGDPLCELAIVEELETTTDTDRRLPRGEEWRGQPVAAADGNAARTVELQADITDTQQLGDGLSRRTWGSTGSVDLPPASAHCATCRSDLLSRSRWRLWEWPMLLLLRRPVRCRTCGRRAFKPLWARIPLRLEL